MHARHLWTLAALLYGALLVTIGFAPGKATRRSLPRFLIADIITHVRPLEALVRRMLFAQARTITVTLRAPVQRQSKARAPAHVPVTRIIDLPHDPLAYRRMMLGDVAGPTLRRLCPAHPLDGDPALWKHVRFCVGAGDYPVKLDRGHPDPRRGGRKRAVTPPRATSPECATGVSRRRNRGTPSIPWYKLDAAEKDARRMRRTARNVASELKRERQEALAAQPVPERVWSAADLALIPTITVARRLEALARVIRDPTPYARRIARKLARKPALAARIARRVARRATGHVGEVFAAAARWVDADLALPCQDSS